LDTEFHATIASASKNSVFTKIVGDIRESLLAMATTTRG
jgi:DNA-binding FadR family transcriptional regulator